MSVTCYVTMNPRIVIQSSYLRRNSNRETAKTAECTTELRQMRHHVKRYFIPRITEGFAKCTIYLTHSCGFTERTYEFKSPSNIAKFYFPNILPGTFEHAGIAEVRAGSKNMCTRSVGGG